MYVCLGVCVCTCVCAYLHFVKDGARGEDIVSALGVLFAVFLRPVGLAGAGHAHHEDNLYVKNIFKC